MKLISWNIWGMPLINPNSYTSPIKVIQQTIDNFDKTHELQIFSIQECWVWRAGIFHWITKQMIYIIPNKVLCLLHILSILLTSVFLTYTYNPMDYVKLPERCYVYQENKIQTTKLMNSGLVMITNYKADEYGFEYFKSNSGLENIASKGFQYIYYEDINTIIINTHLQSGNNNDVKENQLKQIREFIDTYEKCNIFINGDFNINIDDTENDKISEFIHFKKLNGFEKTTDDNKCYDHCYTNVELDYNNIDYEIHEDDISDHYKLTINIDKDFRIA